MPNVVMRRQYPLSAPSLPEAACPESTPSWTFRHPAAKLGNPPFDAVDDLRCPAALLGDFVAKAFSHGTVHKAPEDLQAALRSNAEVLDLWEGLTPLGRNEFICWVEDAKQPATRQRRIARTCEELLEGKKRPCCWVGCIHRTDKPPSRWQQAVLIDGKGRAGS